MKEKKELTYEETRKVLFEAAKMRKKINLYRNILMICNFSAGLFVIAIYIFAMREITFLILGGLIILLDIPAYFVFNNIRKKLDAVLTKNDN